MNAAGPTIGLCMIAKNESAVILRCLNSARPLLDYVLVEDTGSTDGTQAIIRDWLDRVGLPGEVIEEPWRDFAYNRSHALMRLRENKRIAYALMIDADDQLVIEPGFDVAAFKQDLSRDYYMVQMRNGSLHFSRGQICSNRREFRYRGVLHEFLAPPPGKISSGTASGLHISVSREGARGQDPGKYRKDAQLLDRALQKERDSFLRARYTFYLARSYHHAGDNENALKNYLKRAKLGGWMEEIFVSLYSAGQLQEATGRPFEEVMATYRRASNGAPRRAEALHAASSLCRRTGKYADGYKHACRGVKIPLPADGLFVETWIYDYGLLDEVAVSAYWIEAYQESLEACRQLLNEGKMPADTLERVKKNAAFAAEKIRIRDSMSSPAAAANAAAPVLSEGVLLTIDSTSECGDAKSPRDYRARVDDLIGTLNWLVDQRPIALLDWPFFVNCGDHFIWLGEKVLFKKYLRSAILYECSIQHVDFSQLAGLPPETVLVMQGGGNFGDLYPKHQKFREAIIAAFPDRRVLIMPQTVLFQSRKTLQQSAQRMALHPDLHVMARDHESLTTLRAQMGLQNCYLHIDAAFALQDIVAVLQAKLSVSLKYDVLHLLRSDAEAGGISALAEEARQFDWTKKSELAEFSGDAPEICSIDIAREIFDGDLDRCSWHWLCAAVRLLCHGRRIVTDRLHGHVLALMMGKEHDFYDNSYGKNAGFCSAWTRGDKLVTFIGGRERGLVR
jgi:exopolysaccharide biosynthesis predicted pyruvyltransferase EpsI/tetratricopeptide (TPR) repeat protein